MSPRPGRHGVPTGPSLTPPGWSSSTRAGSTPAWPGPMPVPPRAGAPSVGAVPGGPWERLTVIGALGLDGVIASMSIAAATSGAVFLAFVEQALIPALRGRPDAIVVMDNPGAHKAGRARGALEAAEAEVTYRYLPA